MRRRKESRIRRSPATASCSRCRSRRVNGSSSRRAGSGSATVVAAELGDGAVDDLLVVVAQAAGLVDRHQLGVGA